MEAIKNLYSNWVIDPIYINLGLTNPFMRFFLFAAVTTGILFVIRPFSLFGAHGARSWIVANPNEDATYLPWWLVSIIGGLIGVAI